MKSGELEKIRSMKNSVIIATVNSKRYNETNIMLIKYLTKEIKIPGVYVTLNKPFSTVKSSLEKAKVDTKLILFIDAITKTSGGDIDKTKECLFIGNPENLSDISLAMDQAVSSLPSKDKFLFFDSLTTLLLYNDAKTISRFIHFLSGKMRTWGIRGIIISLEEKANKELIDELTQFCDMRLKF